MGANIYDLEAANIEGVDYRSLGYRACTGASARPVRQGSVGAGLGATVGKFLGLGRTSKGGVGSALKRLPTGHLMGALVVTNCVGNVYDIATGRCLAGARRDEKGFYEFDEVAAEYIMARRGRGTTIGVVATDAGLTHEQLMKLAMAAHDGLAMAFRPCHMSVDGDTFFAVSTGPRPKELAYPLLDVLCYAAALCVAEAVRRSILKRRRALR